MSGMSNLIGWELLIVILAVVLNGEKGGRGVLAAIVVFNLIMLAAFLIGN